MGISPENTFGDVTPEGKADCISELKKQGRKVAMVGDGINDAAALAVFLMRWPWAMMM